KRQRRGESSFREPRPVFLARSLRVRCVRRLLGNRFARLGVAGCFGRGLVRIDRKIFRLRREIELGSRLTLIVRCFRDRLRHSLLGPFNRRGLLGRRRVEVFHGVALSWSALPFHDSHGAGCPESRARQVPLALRLRHFRVPSLEARRIRGRVQIQGTESLSSYTPPKGKGTELEPGGWGNPDNPESGTAPAGFQANATR